MKTFELSSSESSNGRRKFKAILYEIYPDSCIDEAQQAGTIYNENGITWIREYCENALPSIYGMSLKCEFLDENRTELCGHGDTGQSPEDGLPVYENAVVIGVFDNGYIQDVEMPDGTIKTFCIGEGTIDGLCYHNFCSKLEKDIKDGNAPFGSVEIMKTGDNPGIVYKYGYKDKGRIPMIFEHSGYALIGVKPADKYAKILELNNKEDLIDMTEAEIKDLVSQVVNEMSSHTSEINKCKEECDKKVAEANEAVQTVTAEKEELIAETEKIKAALEQAQLDLEKKYQEEEQLYKEIKELREELAKAQARERISEMNKAIETFSEEEKAYAKEEIDAFNVDPVSSEINSIVTKIWEGIGKKAKEEENANNAKTAELNSANANIDDIFADVVSESTTNEDTNIF